MDRAAIARAASDAPSKASDSSKLLMGAKIARVKAELKQMFGDCSTRRERRASRQSRMPLSLDKPMKTRPDTRHVTGYPISRPDRSARACPPPPATFRVG